ncbi:aminotransferase class IV [Azospirillum griseum]
MMRVWLDGRLQEVETARIDPRDRGFTLGDGLFETVRIARGDPQRFDRHLARLRRGADLLGIAVPVSDAELRGAVADLCAAEGMADAVLRITLTQGPAARGLLPPPQPAPTLLLSVAPVPPPLPPAQLIVARDTRRNELSPLSRVKSLNYLDNVLARREAERRGGNEAVLLNSVGRVAETSIANLFLVRNGQLVTPPVAEGALPGVLRAAILEAQEVIEQPVEVADLLAADEIVLSNSLGLRPVVSLERLPVGDGQPGPFCAALARRLSPTAE